MKNFTFTWFFRQKRRELTLKFWLEPLRSSIEWVAIPAMRLFGCQCFMLEEGPFPTSYWPRGMTRPANGGYLHFYYLKGWRNDIIKNGKMNPIHELRNESIIPLREDFDAETGEPLGVLIEEERTNLLRDSY